MKKNTIVQFVCFQTNLNLDTFTASWEPYAKSLGKDVDVVLHQHHSLKKKFAYVSRHTSSQDDFRFLFVKGKKPEHFVDYSVKVVQAGGYIPVQIDSTRNASRKESKVLVFLSEEVNLEAFKKLHFYEDLNIYQAYFESSTYSYILEFFVLDHSVEKLVTDLKQICNEEEIAVYKECLLQEA